MPETSKTADHALAVLLELSDHGPLTPVDLARRLDLNRTVIHRLIATLHGRGFVLRTEDGYVPGAILIRMAERVQPELRAAAVTVMSEVVAKIGETMVLHIADGDQALVLEQVVASNHVLRVEHEAGSRHPLTEGASGRALLAYLPQGTVSRLRRRSKDPALLDRQIEAVREQGYSLSEGEVQEGVHGLAVPVLDLPDHAIASLAVIAPTTRSVDLVDHVKTLQTAAARVAAALSGNGYS